MRYIIGFVFLLLCFSVYGQTVRTVGLVYVASAPTHTPSSQGAWLAVDTTSGSWYEWERTTGVWRDAGYRVQFTYTSGAPNYTPSKARGRVAVNSGDSLYVYQNATWNLLSGGGGGADNWGTDVVNSDGTLSGDGTVGSPLKVDTSVIATIYDINSLSSTDTSGYNLAFTRSSDTLYLRDGNGTLSVVLPAGSVDTDDQGLTIGGSGPTYSIDIDGGSDVTISAGGIITLSEGTANVLTLTSTEVDGSITNEIQQLDTFSLSGTTISASLSSDGVPAKTINLSGIGLISSGVAGYLPQYTSATALDTTGLYWDATTGRLGIGVASSLLARLHVKGTGSTNLTTALLVENSAGTDALQILDNGWTGFNTTPTTGVDILLSNPSYQNFNVRNSSGNILNTRHDGLIRLGSAGAQFGPTNSIFNNYLVDLGTFGFMCPSNWSTGGNNIGYWFYDRGAAATSGNLVDFKIGGIGATGFNPTSGTATYTELEVRPRYNQTGTASGYVAGIDYNPITTAILGAHYGLLIRSGRSGFGTATPAASAIVDMTSTTQGLLPPRGTTAQMNAIASPAEGLMFYDLTVHKLYVYDGTAWQACF